MSDSYQIDYTSTAASSPVHAGGSTTNADRPVARHMPPVVLASELYFWSAKWQAQEKAFEAARASGELIHAASMDDVIRDLMTVDDDDLAPADDDDPDLGRCLACRDRSGSIASSRRNRQRCRPRS